MTETSLVLDIFLNGAQFFRHTHRHLVFAVFPTSYRGKTPVSTASRPILMQVSEGDRHPVGQTDRQ